MSVLALFYMAVTPLLANRYSATGRYYTWLVIVTGLIIPFRPRFNFTMIHMKMPYKTMGQITQTTGSKLAAAAVADPIEYVPLPSASSGLSLWQVIFVVWLAGAVIFLAYHAARYYRFLKISGRWSRSTDDEQALAMLNSLKDEMGISKKIGLYLCASIGSPMMIGFLHPRLLLPDLNLSKEEMRFILKHELIHYKRRDIWCKCLVLAATAIHWFNPIVYLIAKAVDKLCELSCDIEVVRGADVNTRLRYSETLLGVVRYRSKLETELSTSFNGGKKMLKNRISSIMDTKKKKAGLAVICAVIIMTISAGIVMAASAPDNTPNLSSGGSNDGVIIKIANNDTLQEDYGTYASNVNSRPDLEFYVEGKDIAQIKISCKTEFVYAVDWTKTQHEKYWNMDYYQPYDEELQTSVFHPERLYDKTMTMTFDEGFSDYADIWYRWTAWNMYTWASEDNYSHILGSDIKVSDDMTQQEKLALAAGNDGSGRTGLGHIQLNGYPEELTEDRITIIITYRNGDSITKAINVKVSNNELNQTVVTASLEN